MNVYIILNHGIGNIGGGQLYVSSKKRYMEELGWKVIVFYYLEGEILIPNLIEFKDNRIMELNLSPLFYRKTIVNKVLSRLEDKIIDNEKVIIESGSSGLAMWGELLAERIKAKHIIYNLNEDIKVTKSSFDFFNFKYERKEFAGITPQSLHIFFKGFKDVQISEDVCLRAYYDPQQVADIDFDITEKIIEKKGINIALCGRLDKPFMIIVAEKLQAFSLKYPELKINLIVIGGDPKGYDYTEKIQKLFLDNLNVNCFMLGFLFPIPKKLLNTIDYAISNAGFASMLANNKIVTLTIDAIDNYPIGIYGITTNSNLFRESEKKYDYHYWFCKMFIDQSFQKANIKVNEISDNMYLKLSSHVDFINNSFKTQEYCTNFGRNVSIIKRIIVSMIGVRGYNYLHKIKINRKS